MPVIEFEGKSTEEAIENACNQLHLAKNELKFEIVTTGSSGIFGLGGKKARIKVIIQEKISSKKDTVEPEDKPAEKREPSEKHREPDSRKDETVRPKRENKAEAIFKKGPLKSPDFDESEKSLPIIEDEVNGISLAPTMIGEGDVAYDGPEDEDMIKGREALEKILGHMEMEAKVTSSKISDRIILTVDGENTGLLIGKKGTTLDALQFLINKIVNRSKDEKIRVIVDAENYRQRRHQSLVELANRMADKAKRNRRPVTISQLSAHDRRVVHLALQEKTGLKTRSRGDGPLKNIIIIPGNKKNDRGGSRKNLSTRNERNFSKKENSAAENKTESN